jgi:hypothetical protein
MTDAQLIRIMESSKFKEKRSEAVRHALYAMPSKKIDLKTKVK